MYYSQNISDELSGLNLPEGHPIKTYLMENLKILELIESSFDTLDNQDFDMAYWKSIFSDLAQYKIHLSRKSTQLYPYIEFKDMDLSTTVLKLSDDKLHEKIVAAHKSLFNEKIPTIKSNISILYNDIADHIEQEVKELFPLLLKDISEDEFKVIHAMHKDIGYCLIPPPEGFLPESDGKNHLDDALTKELESLQQKNEMQNENMIYFRYGHLREGEISGIFNALPLFFAFMDKSFAPCYIKPCPYESINEERIKFLSTLSDNEKEEMLHNKDFYIEKIFSFGTIELKSRLQPLFNEKGQFLGVMEVAEELLKI